MQFDPMQILQYVSAALGALYALTLVVNVFNPLIALRWPRLAAVLSTMGGHVADARSELSAIKLASKLAPLPILALALTLAGCTATQGRLDAALLDLACKGGVVVLGDPGAAPLCVAPDLIEKWIETLNPPTTTMGARAPATPAARYAAALAVGAKPIKVSP